MPANIPEKFIAIAIVEDNKFVRAGWEAILSAVPDFVLMASFGSCEEAFESEDIAHADVVLMDIGLPGMSGIDGVRYLREHHPKLITVICTVHDEDEKVFDAICAGAMGYLLKKVSPEGLVRALREAMEGGSPMTPNIARKVIASMQVPQPTSPDPSSQLNEKESEVLFHLAEGRSYNAIADEMEMSVNGVRYYIRKIYEKLQVHTRAEAIARGHKDRLIRPPRR